MSRFRDVKRITDFLPSALRRPEVLRTARAQRAMRHWAEVVGPLLAERSVAERYQEGTLWVAAKGPAWAQELRMRKDQVLQRLNEIAAEQGLFQDMRVGVRPSRPKP